MAAGGWGGWDRVDISYRLISGVIVHPQHPHPADGTINKSTPKNIPAPPKQTTQLSNSFISWTLTSGGLPNPEFPTPSLYIYFFLRVWNKSTCESFGDFCGSYTAYTTIWSNSVYKLWKADMSGSYWHVVPPPPPLPPPSPTPSPPPLLPLVHCQKYSSVLKVTFSLNITVERKYCNTVN